MVAIGKKASAAKPEMPGAAGAYAALDRLQSSLEAKQGELKVVADAIGPLWDVEGSRFGTLKKPAIVVASNWWRPDRSLPALEPVGQYVVRRRLAQLGPVLRA